MKRFDVFEVQGIAGFRLALNLQDEFYDFLETRLMAPLSRSEDVPALELINPIIFVNDNRLIMHADLVFTVPRKRIGMRVGSAAEYQNDIVRALDRLMTGY